MLMLPNVTGGANWQGGSYDPETGLLYVFSETVIGAVGLLNDVQRSDMDFIRGISRNPVPPDGGSRKPSRPDRRRAAHEPDRFSEHKLTPR